MERLLLEAVSHQEVQMGFCMLMMIVFAKVLILQVMVPVRLALLLLS